MMSTQLMLGHGLGRHCAALSAARSAKIEAIIKWESTISYLGTKVVLTSSPLRAEHELRDLLWLRRIRLDDVFIYLEQTMDIPYAKNGTIL